MDIKINQGVLKKLTQDITKAISSCVDEGVTEAQETVHVVTGRNRESIRQEEPEVDGDVVTFRIKAGGVRIDGVDVDYSAEEETRHPLIRASAIPAISKAVQNLKFS